jgi:hypothetical protein
LRQPQDQQTLVVVAVEKATKEDLEKLADLVLL